MRNKEDGEKEMNYEDWKKSIPEAITADPLWSVGAYRLAIFIGDLGWHDVTKLMRDKRTFSLSDQLYRSLGSISANLAEGYSYGTGKNRARFYEYALGSARESRDWYYKGRHVLGENVTSHRLHLLRQIIRLLLTMIPQQRGQTLKEAQPKYVAENDTLLTNVPMPSDDSEGGT
jgi:four helix bundle protein